MSDQTRPSAGVSHRIGAGSLLAIFLLSGCQRGAAPGAVAADNDKSQAAASVNPRALLERMVAAYHKASSYEDAAELHFLAAQAGEKEEEPPALPFSLALVRPNKF